MKSSYKKYAIIGGSVVAALAIVFGVLVLVKPGHKLPVEDPNSSVSSAPTAPESSEPTETKTTVGEETTTTVPEAPTKPTATTTKAPTTTKKPTTTTKQPTTTTKVPTQPVKDPHAPTIENGVQVAPGRRNPPEIIIKDAGITMDEYKAELERIKNYKCEWCNMHNCKSIMYYVDANGDAYGYTITRSKCPVWTSEEHKCPYCGKIVTDDGALYDTDHNKYCLSSLCRFSVG